MVELLPLVAGVAVGLAILSLVRGRWVSAVLFAAIAVLVWKGPEAYRDFVLSDAERARDAAEASAAAATCDADLRCLGDKHNLTAAFKCREPVERLSRFAFEWTDGVLEPKFGRFRWKDQAAGVVTYLGDRARMQNEYGAWMKAAYECDLDTRSGVALEARLLPAG